MDNAVRKVMDIIDMESYDSGYATGYVEGCDDGYKAGVKERKQQQIEEDRRWLYFAVQKLIGGVILFSTALTTMILEGDATISLFTVPVGLTLIFSKKKCWTGQQWCEMEFERGSIE